eukprot:1555075-Rhodomonas_salina.3
MSGNTMDVLEHNVKRNKDRVKGKVSTQRCLTSALRVPEAFVGGRRGQQCRAQVRGNSSVVASQRAQNAMSGSDIMRIACRGCSQAAPFDLILGTDLMYAADNDLLLQTILALSHPRTQVLLSALCLQPSRSRRCAPLPCSVT